MLNSRLFWILLCLILLPVFVHAGPKIQHWSTENGGRVYFVRAQGLPLLDLRVVFDAGSARDGEKFGVAALTSGLLDSGTKKWNADTIAERLDQVGAVLNAETSRDTTSISLRCLTKDIILKSALETLRQIMIRPSFNQADFDREKQRVLVSLSHREQSPGTLASIAYYQAIYGDHPYAHPVNGSISTVEKLTREDLLAFYRRYYLANNAIVVIVGDISRSQAESISSSLLRDLPNGENVPPVSAVQVTEAASVKRQKFPSEQTHIYSGMPILARGDPDYAPLYVGNHILGGSGLVSKITEEVREKRGLSYSAYSYFSPLSKKGPFTMGLQTRNDQADKAYGVLNETLKTYIENGPSPEELDRSKKNITGGFVLRYDSNQKLAGYVALIGFYRLPLDYLDSFPKRVRAVSREDIKRAFERRVQQKYFQTIILGG